MKHLNEDIHAKAREATARQTYKAIKRLDHPDIVVAMILRALDEWFEKGTFVGKNEKGGSE